MDYAKTQPLTESFVAFSNRAAYDQAFSSTQLSTIKRHHVLVEYHMLDGVKVAEWDGATNTGKIFCEVSDSTVKGYLKKAMNDTLSGRKDRNNGMSKAMSRLSGTNKPLMKSVNEGEDDDDAKKKRGFITPIAVPATDGKAQDATPLGESAASQLLAAMTALDEAKAFDKLNTAAIADLMKTIGFREKLVDSALISAIDGVAYYATVVEAEGIYATMGVRIQDVDGEGEIISFDAEALGVSDKEEDAVAAMKKIAGDVLAESAEPDALPEPDEVPVRVVKMGAAASELLESIDGRWGGGHSSAGVGPVSVKPKGRRPVPSGNIAKDFPVGSSVRLASSNEPREVVGHSGGLLQLKGGGIMQARKALLLEAVDLDEATQADKVVDWLDAEAEAGRTYNPAVRGSRAAFIKGLATAGITSSEMSAAAHWKNIASMTRSVAKTAPAPAPAKAAGGEMAWNLKRGNEGHKVLELTKNGKYAATHIFKAQEAHKFSQKDLGKWELNSTGVSGKSPDGSEIHFGTTKEVYPTLEALDKAIVRVGFPSVLPFKKELEDDESFVVEFFSWTKFKHAFATKDLAKIRAAKKDDGEFFAAIIRYGFGNSDHVITPESKAALLKAKF